MADLCGEGIPLSEKDLEQMKNVFISLPSYENESISTNDLTGLALGIHWTQSPAQLQVYKTYLDKYFGGRIKLKEFLARFAVLHDTAEVARTLATQVDTDGDGIISVEEFKDLFHNLTVFNPKLVRMTYDDFVGEADTNKDGLVSVAELSAWLAKHLKSEH